MKNTFQKIKLIISTSVLLVAPLSVSAAESITVLIGAATRLVTNILIPVAFALCIFYFFWGIAKYIRTSAGGDKVVEEGKRAMVYGIIGIFVVFSVWGIIKFIQSETGILPIDQAKVGDTD